MLRPDRVVYGQRRLGYEGVAISLSSVFPEERSRLVVLMMVVLVFTLDTNDVVAEARDEMDANMIVMDSKVLPRVLEGARTQSSCAERVMANIRMSQEAKEPRHGTAEGFGDGRQQSKQEKLGTDEMRRHGERRFECTGDWISVVARKKSRDSEGIESRVAVAVFDLPGVKCRRSCLDLSARKVNGKLRDVSFWYANPRMAETCKVSTAVSETSDMRYDVFGVFELPVEIVPHNARMIGKNGNSCFVSSLSELEEIEDMTITIANSEYTRRVKRARH